jgi:hypothetical protein
MTISHEDFAQRMLKALRRLGVTDDLRYDSERFALSGGRSENGER